jgi:hypothetical protein
MKGFQVAVKSKRERKKPQRLFLLLPLSPFFITI